MSFMSFFNHGINIDDLKVKSQKKINDDFHHLKALETQLKNIRERLSVKSNSRSNVVALDNLLNIINETKLLQEPILINDSDRLKEANISIASIIKVLDDNTKYFTYHKSKDLEDIIFDIVLFVLCVICPPLLLIVAGFKIMDLIDSRYCNASSEAKDFKNTLIKLKGNISFAQGSFCSDGQPEEPIVDGVLLTL